MMQELLLLAAMTLIMIFGGVVLKNLDGFLERNRKEQEAREQKCWLWIGCSNPLAAESIADVFDRCSAKYPGMSVHIFSGTEEELEKRLHAGLLDVIFLSEHASLFFENPFNNRRVLLEMAPVHTRYDGIPVEPIAGGDLPQKAFWSKKNPATAYLVQCLEEQTLAAETKNRKHGQKMV
ncbi:hypothetical protein ACQRBN_05780 [Bariatricus sp. SGI.154]|uniref:hypothetical protein n=1 Tax=Bariatricus sp. SGI.154 TaxID=3420549 RepID=UPI003D056847